MVVNGEKIFFSSATLFEKMGGVNLDGGGYFEKKSGEKPFSLRHAPSSDTRPCPAEGGGGLQRIVVQNIYTTICGSPRSGQSQILFR